MIIMDLSQVLIATLMVSIGNHKEQVDEGLLRHLILNSIRANVKKFRGEYGELVIACDGRNYWRKNVYPYYKANRSKGRSDSPLEWNSIFTSLNKVRDELKEYFPYKIIEIEGAEADDIIGTLVHEHGTILDGGDKILILSGDKDYVQLQTYGNVRQWDPTRKKWVKHHNPEEALKEKIIVGDKGDGVPNILSSDSCLVEGQKQGSIFKKKLEVWLKQTPEEFCSTDMLRNYHRNRLMIDLTQTPIDIKNSIIESYNTQPAKTKAKLFNYFVKNKLKNLMASMGDF